MKKNKKIIGLSLVVLLAPTFNMNAADINGIMRLYDNDEALNNISDINGNANQIFVPAVRDTSLIGGVEYQVINENNEVVAEGTTDNNGKFDVTNLPEGKYVVRLSENEQRFEELLVANVPRPYTFMGNEITITDKNAGKVMGMVVKRLHSIITYTQIGKIPGGRDGKDVSQNDISYRIFYNNPGVKHYEQDSVDFNYLVGALEGTKYSLYPKEIFAEPILSDEEKEIGYKFEGWSVVGDNDPNKVYTKEEILNRVVKNNIQLQAKFSLPTHKVTFITDSDKGTIDNDNNKSFEAEGNITPISEIVTTLPQPVAKDGYEFVGWYVDMSTNIIPNDEILNKKVSGDLVYFAKYRKLAPVIEIGENGNWIIEGKDTGKTARGEKGDKGDKGDQGVQGEKGDKGDQGAQGEKGDKGDQGAQGEKGDKGDQGARGEKGDKGDQGAQGEKGDKGDQGAQGEKGDKGDQGARGEKGDKGDQGARGEKGDKGDQGEQGDKGKDGQSVSILKIEQDKNGNNVVVFSDGSKITILNGKDGKSIKLLSTKVLENGEVEVTFDDKSTIKIPAGKKGDKGEDGKSISIISSATDKYGNTIINFSDGKSTVINKGEDGKDGKSISVSSTKYDDKGNTIIEFSDGSSAVIAKGRDGKSSIVTIGEDGNWYVDGENTGVSVKGENESIIKRTLKALPNTGIVTGFSLLLTTIVGILAYMLGRTRREK